jgi:hypothetical protein
VIRSSDEAWDLTERERFPVIGRFRGSFLLPQADCIKIEMAFLDALEMNLSDLRTSLSVIFPVPADNATRMHILHLCGVPDRRFEGCRVIQLVPPCTVHPCIHASLELLLVACLWRRGPGLPSMHHPRRANIKPLRHV